MVEATPRTFLKSAKNVFEEGEMLSSKRSNETQNIMRGYLKTNEPSSEKVAVNGDIHRRRNKGVKENVVGEGFFFTNLLNGFLILINALLLGLVIFASYMLYTVDS